jgi:hypothetical protein
MLCTTIHETLQMEGKSFHPTYSQKTLKTKQYQGTLLITALCGIKQGTVKPLLNELLGD